MLRLTGSNLSGQEVVRCVRQGEPVELDADQLQKVRRSRELIVELIRRGKRFTESTRTASGQHVNIGRKRR